VRAKRVRALRRFEAMLAEATGAEPSKLSFRRIKRAHGEARRLGFVPREARKEDVGPAERL
jgi:hypothetical protein